MSSQPTIHADGIPESIADLKTAPAKRREKSPSERIERLETRTDEHALLLAKMSGQLDGQDKVLASIDRSVSHLTAREGVAFAAGVDVARAKSVADVEDKASATINKRERKTKIIVAAIGGATALFEILRQTGIL